jgi:cyclophilin family peptidyl-prolyl cis-trans isomerase
MNRRGKEVMKFTLYLIAALILFAGVAISQNVPADPKKIDIKDADYTKRNKDNPEIAIETSKGTMTFELYRDVAPAHVDSMLARIRDGFYDGLKIFRLIKGFMLQTGDPNNNGTGNAGYNLPAEFSDLKHERGTLSMARGRDVNSASSQFFICFTRRPSLDKKYTVFGQMMTGNQTLVNLQLTKVKANPRTKEMALPVEDIFMKKVTILKDIPGEEKPAEKTDKKTEQKTDESGK